MQDFLEITSIDAPSSASAGSAVNVAITVKSYCAVDADILVTGYQSGDGNPFINMMGAHNPSQSLIYNGQFIMPNYDVAITVYAYIWMKYDPVPDWRLDDMKACNVALSTAVAGFQSLCITGYQRG